MVGTTTFQEQIVLSDDMEIKKRISIDLEHGGLVRSIVILTCSKAAFLLTGSKC